MMTPAFRDQAHSFFLVKTFFLSFLKKNSSKNANETSFKKLTVMKNVNISMITKKKEIISLILILLGRREKKCVKKCKTAGN